MPPMEARPFAFTPGFDGWHHLCQLLPPWPLPVVFSFLLLFCGPAGRVPLIYWLRWSLVSLEGVNQEVYRVSVPLLLESIPPAPPLFAGQVAMGVVGWVTCSVGGCGKRRGALGVVLGASRVWLVPGFVVDWAGLY